MIIIMECTDCKHCASFGAGTRVACLHPDLPAGNVRLYQPANALSLRSTTVCRGFKEGLPTEFSLEEISEAYALVRNDCISLYEALRKHAKNV